MKKRNLLLLTLALFPILSACNSDNTSISSSVFVEPFTLTVVNKHNQPVKSVSLTNGTETLSTDVEGKVTFQNGKGTIAVNEAPEGYSFKGEYKDDNTLVLDSTLIEGTIKKGSTIGLGDLAYNYSFTAQEYNSNGEIVTKEVTLKDELAKNDFVCVNFFFLTCSWCATEAGAITEAYEAYKDKGYMICIDGVDFTNTADDICKFKQKHQLTMDVSYDPKRMTSGYGVESFPTTIVIDRYGFVCFFFESYIQRADDLKEVFKSFTGSDYKPTMYKQTSYEKLY